MRRRPRSVCPGRWVHGIGFHDKWKCCHGCSDRRRKRPARRRCGLGYASSPRQQPLHTPCRKTALPMTKRTALQARPTRSCIQRLVTMTARTTWIRRCDTGGIDAADLFKTCRGGQCWRCGARWLRLKWTTRKEHTDAERKQLALSDRLYVVSCKSRGGLRGLVL